MRETIAALAQGSSSNLFSVRNRLIAGFVAIGFVLVAAIGATFWELRQIAEESDRIATLRAPSAVDSARMANNIDASLATLRGWMLTGNESYKADRAAVWNDIEHTTDELDHFSANWTNPASRERWSEFKGSLAEFQKSQAKAEAIAHSSMAFPANKILIEEAAPHASILLSEITKMIEIEQALAATPARKEVLGIMADVRETVARGLTDIRAYLLTGDETFKQQFEQPWQKNTRCFADLEARVELLISAQRAA